MTKTITIHDFLKRFPDDDACMEHLMELRYGRDRVCPKCRRDTTFYKRSKRPAYECNFCGHDINPMAGTIFHRSHTPLHKWFYAIYLFTTSRHGVPAKELQRQLGVTYKTAWRMGHQIRKHMAETDGDNGLSGHVEADETMVGGYRPGKRGRGATGKTVVFGMLERGGDVMTRVVRDVRRRILEAHILDKIKSGSRICSDELSSYRALTRHGYRHEAVNHSIDEWARGDVHVNCLEGFWSQIKRSIRGRHVHVSRKHLPKYLGKFEFRYNMRKSPEFIFTRLLLAF